MAVLTLKEYEKKKSLNKKEMKEPAKKAPLSKKAKEEKKQKNVYVLLHPENPKNAYLNFEDVIKIDEKEYKRKCINGIVKTAEKLLAEFLIKKREYILLETINESNN